MSYQIITPEIAEQAKAYLSSHDPILQPVIARAGLCTITPHQNYYQALVEEIMGQQLHVKAAATIRSRFVALFDGTFPDPSSLLDKSIDELRTAGLSRAKTSYIQDVARHVIEGKLQFEDLDTLDNDAVIRKLTDVKGIGEWTAHMFLMFCMGRTDILAYGDLGIRAGIQKLYGLDQLPTREELIAIAQGNHWHPYETIACWYVWFSLDNKPM